MRTAKEEGRDGRVKDAPSRTHFVRGVRGRWIHTEEEVRGARCASDDANTIVVAQRRSGEAGGGRG